MRTSEALRKLEEFLDQAYLTNRKEVRIIHGIGSGALRKAVLEYLSTSPYSSTYHEAEPHHGGAGATVVAAQPLISGTVLSTDRADCSRASSSRHHCRNGMFNPFPFLPSSLPKLLLQA